MTQYFSSTDILNAVYSGSSLQMDYNSGTGDVILQDVSWLFDSK